MATKKDLLAWVVRAVAELQPTNVIAVSRWIWEHHETELRDSGDLFYTWQYDVRWAAQGLRNRGVLAPAHRGQRSTWTLSEAHMSGEGS